MLGMSKLSMISVRGGGGVRGLVWRWVLYKESYLYLSIYQTTFLFFRELK